MREYEATSFRRGRRKGYLEAINKVVTLVDNWDIEPCCHGLRQSQFKIKLRELLIDGDLRYKLDENKLKQINDLLEEGYSKNQVAKIMNVSISTICYWTNPDFRRRQMRKNALRKFGKKLKSDKTLRKEQGK